MDNRQLTAKILLDEFGWQFCHRISPNSPQYYKGIETIINNKTVEYDGVTATEQYIVPQNINLASPRAKLDTTILKIDGIVFKGTVSDFINSKFNI